MLPVFTLYRSGNLTETAANDVLGDLKIALAVPNKMSLFCIVAVIFSILGVCACRIGS
jgi:hypothetical protein